MEIKYIKISDYCKNTQIERTFISDLQDEGILVLQQVDNEDCIEEDMLEELEKYSRWHYDLGVNLAGIDAMRHMLQRMQQMEREIQSLKNSLRFFDKD
ncbi:chaperone modulator CbpM [Ornithobacterium rhinotracheale]|uniref:chaperone modulator CbpM n=1 Tax=Ornithobacterium rhinotracheale TaxID=28251 RepID=UPI001FF632A1|nr:chaperone modulator CbpM [Ornithobacterium rhinotracheale]MCK0204246.1 chaperone modulator CbpM [Ornithobacterium rhinotracheale]